MYSSFYVVTVSIGFFFVVTVSCIILEFKSGQYFWAKLQCNPYLDLPTMRVMRQSAIKQSSLLYSVYILCVGVCLHCFLLHISTEFPSW